MAKTNSKKAGKAKEHRNLDELPDADVIEVAKKLKIKLLDHKVPTLKRLIRNVWKQKGIKELPVQALAKVEPKKKQKKMRLENYEFDRHFSNEEMHTKSMQLSAACISRNEIDEERKAVASSFKAKIDTKTAEINKLSSELQTGYEHVLRTCDVDYDYDKSEKIYYFEGKEVGRERMTKQDFQTELEV